MRSSRVGALPSELGALIDDLDDYERRLQILEAPSGEALGSTVARLSALVTNLQAQLDGWVAGRWTNAEIDARIAAPPYGMSIGGSSVVNGTLNVTSDVGVAGALIVPSAYATDITWTRRAGAVGLDGRFGYIPSTRTKKTSIRPADEDKMQALLDAEIFDYVYKAEAEKAALDPTYVARRELGLMAQDLEELGLGAFVYHDADGEPEGVEYTMLVVPLLAIFRAQRAQRLELAERIARLDELQPA